MDFLKYFKTQNPENSKNISMIDNSLQHNCFYHPDIKTNRNCKWCGRYLCESCYISVGKSNKKDSYFKCKNSNDCLNYQSKDNALDKELTDKNKNDMNISTPIKEQVDPKILIRDLNSSNIDQKRKAINRTGEGGVKETLDKLIEILSNQQENDNIRCCAAIALGRIGDSKAVDALISSLKASNWETRDSSASALGNIGDLRAIEPLKQAQYDSDIHVVEAANNALLKLDQRNTVNELINRFNNGNTRKDDLWIIATNLRDVTKKLGADDVKNVSDLCISILKGNDPIRFSAITANNNIKWISKHDALLEERILFIKLLTAALDHKEYKIRGSAAEALGPIISEDQNLENRDQIINKLISMLEDDIFDVRRKTIISLCWYIKDPRAIKPLQKAADNAGDSRKWVLQQIEEIRK